MVPNPYIEILLATITLAFVSFLAYLRYRALVSQRRPTRHRSPATKNFLVVQVLLCGSIIWICTTWINTLRIKSNADGLTGLSHKDLQKKYMKWNFARDQLSITIICCIKAAFITVQYEIAKVMSSSQRILIDLVSGYTFVSFVIVFSTGFIYCRNDLSELWGFENYCSELQSDRLMGMQYGINIIGYAMIAGFYGLVIKEVLINRNRQLHAIAFVLFLFLIVFTGATLRFLVVIASNGKEAVGLNVWMYAELLAALMSASVAAAIRDRSRERTGTGRQTPTFVPMVDVGPRAGGRGESEVPIASRNDDEGST